MANFTERQRQIIDESIKIIANSGIQNLTIKNISKEIGISEAAIYRHFDSKFSILMAILESFENSAQTILDQIDSKKNCIEQIGDFLSDRYANFAAEPNISRVMFSDEIFQNDKRLSAKIASIVHSHKEKLVHCIQQGQAKNEIRNDIPPKDIFRIIMGSMRLTVTQWYLTNYGFDLFDEGIALWESTKKLIENKV